MAREKGARPSVGQGRANSPLVRPDVDIVQERLQREWEDGCKWAGLAISMSFGLMFFIGITFGWV